MISLHFALPEPDHFTYCLVDLEPIFLRRSLFNQGANSGDDFARSLSVIHHKGNRIPRFFQDLCLSCLDAENQEEARNSVALMMDNAQRERERFTRIRAMANKATHQKEWH